MADMDAIERESFLKSQGERAKIRTPDNAEPVDNVYKGSKACWSLGFHDMAASICHSAVQSLGVPYGARTTRLDGRGVE